MNQRTLFDAHARRDDPDTSHDAAASIGDLTSRRRAILDLLRTEGPCTDEHLGDLYAALVPTGIVPPQSPSGLRTRRRELVDLDLVRDTGVRARLRSGRRAIVWRAADNGNAL